MPRFFTETISATNASISGNDAKHIAKVLRMKCGDPLTLCDGQGKDYLCEITAVSEQEIALNVLLSRPSLGEASVRVRLYQASPKADKLELIIQKAVELGVEEIIPVQTKRCVSRPDAHAMEKKLERYNRISQEAAKQSGRGKLPLVRQMLDFREAVEEIATASLGILFYEQASASFRKVFEKPCKDFAILVGAEGGFEAEEVSFAQEKGLHILSLGSRILRCETAPLAALAVIMYETGNLGG